MNTSGRLIKKQKLLNILTILIEIFFRGQNLKGLAKDQVQIWPSYRGSHLSAPDWVVFYTFGMDVLGKIRAKALVFLHRGEKKAHSAKTEVSR